MTNFFAFPAKLLGCSLLLCGLTGTVTAQDAIYSPGAVGKWEDTGNWSGGTGLNGLPGNKDTAVINSTGTTVIFDAATWQYLVSNGGLVGPNGDEYRFGRYRQGTRGGTTTVTFDQGKGNVVKTTSDFTQFVGSATGSKGTLNHLSGTTIFEANLFALGEKAGSVGQLNLSGGSFSIGRGSGGISMRIGPAGNGALEITGGRLTTRRGVTVGPNGTFSVLGSGITEIGIGSYASLDGSWVHEAGGVFKAGIDAGGITPTFIDAAGGSTTATFESGAILDVGFLDGFSSAGTWTVMEVENGAIIDNGLAFAPTVDASVWSFTVDNSGPNGILSVTAAP